MQARIRNLVTTLQPGHGSTQLDAELPVWLLGRCYMPRATAAALGAPQGAALGIPGVGLAAARAAGPLKVSGDAVETLTPTTTTTPATATRMSHLDAFHWDFRSRLWFTYRHSFPRLMQPHLGGGAGGLWPTGGSGSGVLAAVGAGVSGGVGSVSGGLTSDSGWGCMLRTGQMILAQAFMTMALGRDWRLCPGPHALPDEYGEVLRWFADTPHPSAPYSIHHIASAGVAFDKKVGEWFEPTVMCRVLQELVDAHQPHLGPVRRRVRIYVTGDERTVYSDEIANMCVPTNSAVVIFVPLLLGAESTLNPAYFAQLAPLFTWPQFLGIAGGRPRSSMYFVGLQGSSTAPHGSHSAFRPITSRLPSIHGLSLRSSGGGADAAPAAAASEGGGGSAEGAGSASPADMAALYVEDHVIYLDPHTTRLAMDMDGPFNANSFHCRQPLVMPLSSLDPSMALGFLCQSNAEWIDLVHRVTHIQGSSEAPPIFSIAGTRPAQLRRVSDVNDDIDYEEDGCLLGPPGGDVEAESEEDGDAVVLRWTGSGSADWEG